MWKHRIRGLRIYTQYPIQSTDRITSFYDALSVRILKLLDVHPSRSMVQISKNFDSQLRPISIRMQKVLKLGRASRVTHSEIGRAFSAFRYKGVTSLVALNIGAFMVLNSHYMKSRSHSDGLQRSDRHFIASRYNITHGRLWCIPLSLVNHGDSLMHLMMNCFALSVVGPAVEVAFGASVLIGGFLFTGSIGAILEMMMGNHWCRGSSAGVSGIFGMSALAAPHQLLSLWGILDVRALPLAITVFGIESCIGLFGSHQSGMAHVAHAGGLAAALPCMYYLKWFR